MPTKTEKTDKVETVKKPKGAPKSIPKAETNGKAPKADKVEKASKADKAPTKEKKEPRAPRAPREPKVSMNRLIVLRAVKKFGGKNIAIQRVVAEAEGQGVKNPLHQIYLARMADPALLLSVKGEKRGDEKVEELSLTVEGRAFLETNKKL